MVTPLPQHYHKNTFISSHLHEVHFTYSLYHWFIGQVPGLKNTKQFPNEYKNFVFMFPKIAVELLNTLAPTGPVAPTGPFWTRKRRNQVFIHSTYLKILQEKIYVMRRLLSKFQLRSSDEIWFIAFCTSGAFRVQKSPMGARVLRGLECLKMIKFRQRIYSPENPILAIFVAFL